MAQDKVKRTAVYLTDDEAEILKLIMKAKQILLPGRLVLNFNTKGDTKPELDIVGKEAVDNLLKLSTK